MRREYPIPALLHAYLFPDPSPNDPKDFQTHLAKNLVSEVRHETQRFYGGLETVEARYPGLNYSHGPHRKRLGRFPHHARLFKAFDALGLTDHEIAILCRWEGTLWARQRYERDEGIKVVDTTGLEILPCAERRHLKRKADRTEQRPVIARVPSAEGIKVKTEIEVEIEESRGADHAQTTRAASAQSHVAAPRATPSLFHRHDSPLRNSPYRGGPLPTSMMTTMNLATANAPLQQALPLFIAAPPLATPLPAPVPTVGAAAYTTFTRPEARIPDPPAIQHVIVTPALVLPALADPSLEAWMKEAGEDNMTEQQRATAMQRFYGISSSSQDSSRSSMSPSPAPVAVTSDGNVPPSAAEGQGQSVLQTEA